MIVSHKHKFVFIRPKKVAGSSVETALREFCGKEDIATKVRSEEYLDETLIYSKNQNVKPEDKIRSHSGPGVIKKFVGDDFWGRVL